ncbi:MAG: branched-chain amino acid ABC transporter permease [Ilumatobacteraceae bacterium]|nr:branched-chain amino acid ABC transporter permease [Ilumatobacteraceae bacterium]
MFLRPNLYTSYEEETQMLPTYTKKVLAGIAIIVLFLIPFDVPLITASTDLPVLRNIPVISNGIPPLRFLGDSSWLRAMDEALMFAIAALGLNILTGMAGQVSLGHAFFMGVGAYTGAVLGGVATSSVWGWSLPIWIWLPGAGIGAAIVGIIVSPVAVKLRGLYLAIVTLGLVFIGIHMSNTNWGKKLAGDPGLGRDFPTYDIRLWKEETPLVSIDDDGTWFGFLDVTDNQKTYLFLAVLFLLFIVLAKNIARTRTGRALQAIRDRDIAAEVMGVPEFKYKLIAFATSSFFAGVAGALFASFAGKLPASQFSLALSVEFIAILLIGGVGTVSGTVMGTFFVVLTPKFVESFTEWLADKTEGDGIGAKVADVVISNGSDQGPVSAATQTPGYPLNVFDWNLVLYGALIIVFLIFEPLGLYGIWIRIRNYWKRWPFSY